MKIHRVNFRVESENEKTPNLDAFHAVSVIIVFLKSNQIFLCPNYFAKFKKIENDKIIFTRQNIYEIVFLQLGNRLMSC